ncbi:MAG: DivIVA domain-containing protein [Oscillospiraceae bacterium]|nr:DivIVA domain-containing protein [Oscillospiraceae bacterium]
MLTPQEVNDKGFGKVMLNGYDAGEVDDFLEAVSNDYNALYKENAILKGKLKVLVEKVEEYRSTEDAMRMALLTAQRMGEEITSEATRTKNDMLQKAEDEINARMTETAKLCADEERRLEAATKETAKFIEVSQAIMRKHSEFLEKLEAARHTMGSKRPAGQATPDQSAAAKAGRTPKVAQQTRAAPPLDKPVQPVQPPVQPAQPVQHIQPPVQPPVQPSQQQTQPVMHEQGTTSASPVAQPVTANEIEIDDIAMQIGSAVERLTEVEVTPVASQGAPHVEVRSPAFDEPPASLFEDDDSIRLYTPESELEDTSPRPKFDFDDLKFGANFDTDD